MDVKICNYVDYTLHTAVMLCAAMDVFLELFHALIL